MLMWFLFVCSVFTYSTVGAIELQGEMTQGSLIRGTIAPTSQVWFNEQPIKVSKQGHFVFGFSRDDELTHSLRWTLPSGEEHKRVLELNKRDYDIQRIEGLPAKMVTPPEDVLVRIRNDNKQVGAARKLNDERIDFMQTFIWPAAGPISGVYGSQRVLNGQARRPHFGVDVAAPTGTPVYAPADGIVTLWVADMYYSGGTMIIDHGHGVSSTFLHLHAGHVEVGQHVKQGELVAEIGATGRVTGAHLDWRMNWKNVRVDPALLVPARSN